ncbi:MAGUK p55 subfamily member 6-like [Pocillopora damicornis]|uniref:MAGUK p55 subfamily member 6-like n=1 Tax=Pocillopora damicornis TaxID=46731 RepID=UPI000F559318|nr:MAGUK p55 subfamily member 6-like [Pocillopora damicornis]
MVEPTESEQEQSSEAVQTVLKSLDDPKTAGLILEEQANALKSILGDPSVLKLVRAHDKLEEGRKQVETPNTAELAREVTTELEPQVANDDSAAELSGLLQEPHFMALLEVHDNVAFKKYASPPASPGPTDEAGTMNGFGGQPIRMVGLHKQPKKPLGMTLVVEKGELVVARIIHGGMIDRQGLLHVGDRIKEVNGRDMSGNPKELQDLLRESTGKIFLKVIPTSLEAPALSQVFVRAHFDYDPEKDKIIPCKDAGLSFKIGDVLQIVEQEDPNWWQAKRTDGTDEAGIIPSQICEERRRSFVKKDRPGSGFLCGSKKKQKIMYKSAKNADFDRHEMIIYEEVAKMPPFHRKTLVLVGAQGVGRRTLKNRIILSDRARFGTTIPHTTREPREGEENGKGYNFVSREEMEQDIRAGKYLEHGDYEGNLYGTKVDSIREVMRSGKMCILDVNSTALKILKTPEFMPFVVFIASPPIENLREIHKRATSEGTITKKQTDEDLQRTAEESEKLFNSYSHYFDKVIVNDDLDKALSQLKDCIEGLSSEPQWVPVSWVY